MIKSGWGLSIFHMCAHLMRLYTVTRLGTALFSGENGTAIVHIRMLT